ncbi:MAG: hypothetical protein AB9879_13070 [Methanothrix sp.]
MARATVHAEAKDVYGLSYSDWIAKNQVYAAAMQDISFRSAKDVYCYASASTSDGKSRTNDERTAEVSLSMDSGSLASYKGFSYANKDIAYAFQDIDGAVSKARCGQDFGNGIEVISEASDGDNLYRVSTLADTFSGKTYAKGSFAVDSGTSVVTSTSYAKQNIMSASSDDDEAATVINTRYTPTLGKQQVTLYATGTGIISGEAKSRLYKADDNGVLVTEDGKPVSFGIIQNMVDLAKSKDTIGIGSGTYYENVKIAKDLTISGAGTCGEAGNCDGACGSCSPCGSCGSCGSCDYTPCGSGCGSSHSSCDYDKGKSGGCGNSYFGDYDKGWSNWNSGSSCGNKDSKGCGDRDYYNYEKDSSKECGESYFGGYDRSWSDWGSCSSSGYGTKCGDDDSGDWGDHNSGGCNSGGHGGSGNDCGDHGDNHNGCGDHDSGDCHGGNHDGCGSGSACKVTTINGQASGSVFTIESGATVKLSDMVITNGLAENGGGINNKGTLTVSDAVVKANTASNNGGGIYNAGTLTVKDSTVSKNEAGLIGVAGQLYRAGGGIYNDFGAILSVDGSCISDNKAYNGGGGILSWGKAAVKGTTISNNHLTGTYTQGGGIFSANELLVVDSAICKNSASFGGGIYNFDSSGRTEILDSVISSNVASCEGGGIANYAFAKISGSKMAIVNNEANLNGGGIANYGSMEIDCSEINGNKAGEYGGGIFNTKDAYGGFGTMKLTSVQMSSNNAGIDGGAIYNIDGDIDLSKCLIKYNHAEGNGGGIANIGVSANMDVEWSSLLVNTADLNGGAVYNEGTVTLGYSKIAYNNAGRYYHGGGIYKAVGSNLISSGQNYIFGNSPENMYQAH